MAPLEALFHRLDENGVGSCAPEADVLGGELSRTVYGWDPWIWALLVYITYIYAYIQLYDILLIYVCIYTAYIQYIVTHDNRIYNYIIISSSHLSRGQGVASAKDIATLRFQDIAGGEEETDEPWQSLVRWYPAIWTLDVLGYGYDWNGRYR